MSLRETFKNQVLEVTRTNYAHFAKAIRSHLDMSKVTDEMLMDSVGATPREVLAIFDRAFTEQNEQLQKLRAWLESRKEQYNHNPHEIDFSKDIDDGLQILDKLLDKLLPQTAETTGFKKSED